jgi:hypothetical protein
MAQLRFPSVFCGAGLQQGAAWHHRERARAWRQPGADGTGPNPRERSLGRIGGSSCPCQALH